MTYYAKFSNGPEKDSEINLFITEPQEPGWYQVGDELNSKFYKLVNNTAVEYTEEETSYYLNNLEFNSIIDQLRRDRDIKLRLSDWTQAIDSPLSDSKKQEWLEYRQSLRDFSVGLSTVEQINSFVFPEEPSK